MRHKEANKWFATLFAKHSPQHLCFLSLRRPRVNLAWCFLMFFQLTPLPSCTAASAASCWREPCTPSSNRRATPRRTNTPTTRGRRPGRAKPLPRICAMHFGIHLYFEMCFFFSVFGRQGVLQRPGVPPVIEQLHRGLVLPSRFILNSSQSHHHTRFE